MPIEKNKVPIISLKNLVDDFSEKLGVYDEDKMWDYEPVNVVQFIEDPQFMDSRYNRNTGTGCRQCVMDDLVSIFGTDPKAIRPLVREAYFSEGVGTGKSTKFSWIVDYFSYKLLCLRDPIKTLRSMGANVDKNTKIALVVLSRTEQNSREVIYAKANAYISKSKWFFDHYWPTPDITSRIEFDAIPKNRNRIDPTKIYKNVCIIPGSSSEYSVLGYDSICVIIDEATKFQAAQDRGLTDEDVDQAEVIYSSASSRIYSRYGNTGLLVCGGNPEHKEDFLERHTQKHQKDSDVYIVKRRSLWNALMPEFNPDLVDKNNKPVFPYFCVDINRRRIVPNIFKGREGVLCVPDTGEYKKKFSGLIEQAIRDLAGIPTEAVGSYLANPGILMEFENQEREDPMERTDTPESPYSSVKPWFKRKDLKWHSLHFDFGETNDAASFVLSHPVKLNENGSPHIYIDLIYRYAGSPERPFIISSMYQWIDYFVNKKRIPIGLITFDSHGSIEMMQTLKLWGYSVENLSIDAKSREVFDLLTQTISEGRLDYFRHDMMYKEYKALERKGDKVVKPRNGSDDVIQAFGGSVWNSVKLALKDDPSSEFWDSENADFTTSSSQVFTA